MQQVEIRSHHLYSSVILVEKAGIAKYAAFLLVAFKAEDLKIVFLFAVQVVVVKMVHLQVDSEPLPRLVPTNAIQGQVSPSQ